MRGLGSEKVKKSQRVPGAIKYLKKMIGREGSN